MFDFRVKTLPDPKAQAKHQRKLAYRREYGKKHRDKLLRYSSENRKKNWPIWRVRYCFRRRFNYLFHWDRTHSNERRHHLKKKYRLTPEQYQALCDEQGGVCAICRQPEKSSRRYLAIDHEHGTNPPNVRGLFCHGCNAALGHVRDDTTILHAMIVYLDQHK